MADESSGVGLIRWIVQGGAWAALATWLGVQQRQMSAMQRHGEKVRSEDRRDQGADLERIRQRVAANEQAITEIREKAITKEDLDHVADRLETSMNKGFTEVRQEISRTHQRVDDVMRDRAKHTNGHDSGEGSR